MLLFAHNLTRALEALRVTDGADGSTREYGLDDLCLLVEGNPEKTTKNSTTAGPPGMPIWQMNPGTARHMRHSARTPWSTSSRNSSR